MARSRLVLLIALVSVALSVGAAFSPRSEAQTQVTCPAGTTLAADGVSCLTDAVEDNVTTTASCLQGVLSADGTQCLVPRLDAPAAPAPAAPVTAPVPTFTG